MLLTETIKNSTSAIKKRRATIESKQNAETYAKALAQLAQATESIKQALDWTTAMKESGIISTPLLNGSTRGELLDCINDCGNGISEMQLTLETVRLSRLTARRSCAVREAKRNVPQQTMSPGYRPSSETAYG